MITRNTKSNINLNKTYVDKYNTQMTTQKKISKASEDPVTAVRSLRLSTSLSHLEQYQSNIEDATSWLSVTETSLKNMISLLTDIRTQCVNGSTDTLKEDDRNTILTNLQQLADQVYSEGNSDYTGRTIFTGYRTTETLTFDEDCADTKYEITQKFDSSELTEHRYMTGDVEVPADVDDTTADCDTNIDFTYAKRLRLAYDKTDSLDSTDLLCSYTDANGNQVEQELTSYAYDVTFADGQTRSVTAVLATYQNENEWLERCEIAGYDKKTVPSDQIIYIKDTGELIFNDELATSLESNKATIQATYTKTGFEEGELRPEYYYDCVEETDPNNPVTFTKQNQEITYEVSNATSLVVNTQASDVFDMNILRDVNELIDIVQKAISAHAKVTDIKEKMSESKYVGDEGLTATLQSYLDAAEKEASYADENMQKTYDQYITNFNNYMEKVNIANTNVGSTEVRLSMTQTRVENQTTTTTELKSQNEDRDLSDVIIDYYAAYYAYQASLTAAGKLNQTTLLDYI
jgi:flagellar hook-associated protein 3 FlgL